MSPIKRSGSDRFETSWHTYGKASAGGQNRVHLPKASIEAKEKAVQEQTIQLMVVQLDEALKRERLMKQ